MCCFGAVVQAEFAAACQRGIVHVRTERDSPFAALALERKKVELMTEGHLAVSANGFDVGSGHFGVALF
jgi:hypothetical protein